MGLPDVVIVAGHLEWACHLSPDGVVPVIGPELSRALTHCQYF